MVNQAKESIAIIGIGCRFPGNANNAQNFWNLLKNEVDAIVDIPADRWDIRRFYAADFQKAGKAYVRQGGFLCESFDYFDAAFFGISPREAPSVDPQQRLLLEVAWEAFEDAGLPIESVNGKNVGVFIGGFTLDSLHMQFRAANRHLINSHTATGISLCALAARISYTFNLHGPCVTMDTACSSSLTAVHYACQSLWNGESNLAVAGGVNLMFAPEYAIAMCKGQFLSPDARCKAFDAQANGYARGEGAGIVILKPLSKALADKDPIYALVRATGINHDGRTVGMASPNPLAQEALIRHVHELAGVSPDQIHYVEAHGTGTKAGDIAEASALGLAIGKYKPNKLIVGSVKTNIGHLEAAAGAASLIKTALCLQKRQLPPNLHFKTPNPEIPFDDLGLRIPQALEEWPTNKTPARAGINSFGYGGTNAHIVMEEPPIRTVKTSLPLAMFLLPLSARSPVALQSMIKRYLTFLADDHSLTLFDLCFSASVRRSHHEYRLAVIFNTQADLMEKLQKIPPSKLPADGIRTTATMYNVPPKTVFVYSGMGPQWWYMGRELLLSQQVFQNAFVQCDNIFRKLAGWSLQEELLRDEASSRIHQAQVAQPLNFAFQVALTAMWAAWGVKPDAVIGHSVGEIAAAYTAGCLSLEDAVRLSYFRSKLQQTLAGKGKMLAVELSPTKAQELIIGLEDQLSVGAINGLDSVVLSGNPTALESIAIKLDKLKIFHRFTRVDIAYHSYQMEPLHADFLALTAGISPLSGNIPFYSTVTGQQIDGLHLDNNYWWNNLRQTVLFSAAFDQILLAGYNTFIEIGAHPVLGGYIKSHLFSHKAVGITISSQHREQDQFATLLNALSQLYISGYPVQWNKLYPPENGNYLTLPSYPWDRKQYFLESSLSQEDRLGPQGHILLGFKARSPHTTWEMELTETYFPFLQDHLIHGKAVFPGAGYIEIGLAVDFTANNNTLMVIEDLQLQRMLILDPHQETRISIHYDPKSSVYTIYSTSGSESSWEKHATGRLLKSPLKRQGGILAIENIRSRCTTAVSGGKLYDSFRQIGLDYGPLFQGIKKLWRGPQEALVEIECPADLVKDCVNYHIHPVILDSCFQSLIALTNSPESENRLYLPANIERIAFYKTPGTTAIAYIQVISQTAHAVRCNITLYDEQMQACIECVGVHYKVFPMETKSKNLHNLFYEWLWKPLPLIKPTNIIQDETWIIFSNNDQFNQTGTAFMHRANLNFLFVKPGDSFKQLDSACFQINPESIEEFNQLFSTIDNCQGILYLWGGKEAEEKDLIQTGINHCVIVRYLVQALSNKSFANCRLFLITKNTQAVTAHDSTINLSSAPLWGLGRVVMTEYPDLKCSLIDVDAANEDIHSLMQECIARNEEQEISYRGNKRYVHRFVPCLVDGLEERKKRIFSTSEDVTLQLKIEKAKNTVYYEAVKRRPPKADELEIEIHSVAVSSLDVLKLNGKYTSEDCALATLGIEAAGQLIAVGSRVDDFKSGDEVIILSKKGCFSSFVTVSTKDAYIVHKPQKLSYKDAPVLLYYVTVYHALNNLAHLARGERLLINLEAGQLAVAAIQYARAKGVEIYATAATPERRNYLLSLGADLVMDSNSVEFADILFKKTNGKGADVILNSTGGEILTKSIRILSPYGRFIQLATQNTISDDIQFQCLKNNTSFLTLDMVQLLWDKREMCLHLINKVLKLIDCGVFNTTPAFDFSATKAQQAFTYLLDPKNTGRSVVLMKNQQVIAKPLKKPSNLFLDDATYLVSGGLSGFGLEVAKWLVQKGARHLVLVGRSGACRPEAQDTLVAMRTAGITVNVQKLDITDAAKLETLLHELELSMPPLKGIFHCAAVLEDNYIFKLTSESFHTVMRPKALGAWNLHQSTQNINLDFFVLFSSIASVIGNSGQGNYAAANAFLDSLAHYRRSLGLPGLAVNWGVLAESGMAARNIQLMKQLEAIGLKGLAPHRALDALEYILNIPVSQIGIAQIDWQQLAAFIPGHKNSTRFANLVTNKDATTDNSNSIRIRLQVMNADEKLKFVIMRIKEEAARVLHNNPAQFDIHHSITALGIDSLMAVELKIYILTTFDIDYPTIDFLGGASIAGIATTILQKMGLSDIVI